MSLEELMSLSVFTVTGTQGELFSTPGAVSVLTGEEVRLSGRRMLADIVGLAPGVYSGRTASHSFSVGMRGFNGSLSNKTLVQIDGRAVYDPLLGGTYWDVQDVFVEDLDQIEIVRGPGATLWGANAVNGVISVTTKSAKETQGLVVNGGFGTYERAFVGARYGMRVGESSWLRLSGKWDLRDAISGYGGGSAHDDWSMARGSFRFDHEGDNNLTFTLQGDIYNTEHFGEYTLSAPVPGQDIQFVSDYRDVRRAGGNILARISREEGREGWALQVYYDRTERETDLTFEVQRDTFDFDFRHHFQLGERHEILWGFGVRHTMDRTTPGYSLMFDPPNGTFTNVGGFVQDTITLVPDRLTALIGSKFSYNTYTGLEVQPSARISWKPNDRNVIWGAVSRPVRVPSRSEEQGMIAFGYIDTGTLVGAPPTGVIIPLGVPANDNLEPETLIAYELGHRVRITDSLSLDTALFFNDYENLIYVASLVDPWTNDGFAETYGGEISLTWRPSERLRVEASYSYVDVHVHGPAAEFDEVSTPHNLATARVHYNVTDSLLLTSTLAYVDNVSHPRIEAEAHWRLDAGLIWKVSENFELGVWGQNLLEPRHQEFSLHSVERGVFVSGTLRF